VLAAESTSLQLIYQECLALLDEIVRLRHVVVEDRCIRLGSRIGTVRAVDDALAPIELSPKAGTSKASIQGVIKMPRLSSGVRSHTVTAGSLVLASFQTEKSQSTEQSQQTPVTRIIIVTAAVVST
jgi:hypothetical protein